MMKPAGTGPAVAAAVDGFIAVVATGLLQGGCGDIEGLVPGDGHKIIFASKGIGLFFEIAASDCRGLDAAVLVSGDQVTTQRTGIRVCCTTV